MTPNTRMWIDLYTDALGADALSETEVDTVLELAGVAAHASERTAAPLSCWLAAKTGMAPSEALAMARKLAASLDGSS